MLVSSSAILSSSKLLLYAFLNPANRGQTFRHLSSTETATALRPFFFAVHPDLFGRYPDERVRTINIHGLIECKCLCILILCCRVCAMQLCTTCTSICVLLHHVYIPYVFSLKVLHMLHTPKCFNFPEENDTVFCSLYKIIKFIIRYMKR